MLNFPSMYARPGLWATILALACQLFPVANAAPISDRAACSSLIGVKQPTDAVFKSIAAMGFRWVDLSCMNWAPHVSVPRLVEDFDKEAARVEGLLSQYKLQTANLTFDACEVPDFAKYERQFDAVTRLAVRLKARLINLMAPSAKADRPEMVRRLRSLQRIASKHGILLTLETHCNQLTELPADALWLCEQVPGIKLTLDPSHYYAGPHQGGKFDELYSHVEGTGFRAGGTNWASIQLPWGEGPIDFAAVVRKLEAQGYAGFYVAEYIEGFNKLDPATESKKFLDWIRQLK